MDWAILIGTTLLASVVTGLVAREVARRIACAGGELGAGVLLLAIVISLVVLQGQGAAKLAVLVEGFFVRQGIDPATALGGDFALMAYIASFVPIAAYVVTFLLIYRRMKT